MSLTILQQIEQIETRIIEHRLVSGFCFGLDRIADSIRHNELAVDLYRYLNVLRQEHDDKIREASL